MIYPELLLGFLKVGCFTFGGAYSAIPLIRDVVLSYSWLSDEELSYMIAVRAGEEYRKNKKKMAIEYNCSFVFKG